MSTITTKGTKPPTPEETSEYRIVYNWAKAAHEICQVWSFVGMKPHAYVEVLGLGTHNDDWTLGEDSDPTERLRMRLQQYLHACDKPVLRFPDDFE